MSQNLFGLAMLATCGLCACFGYQPPERQDGAHPSMEGGFVDDVHMMRDEVTYAACAAAKTLTTQSDLVSVINSLPWEDLHQLVSKTLAVSDDYRVAGTLVLDPGSFSSPPTCPAVMGCPSHPTIWTHRDGLPGVTCKQKSTIKYGGCHRLELKDTTVRFRLQGAGVGLPRLGAHRGDPGAPGLHCALPQGRTPVRQEQPMLAIFPFRLSARQLVLPAVPGPQPAPMCVYDPLRAHR